MDLEHTTCWLRLAQQPYSLVRRCLDQLNSLTRDLDVAGFIEHFLDENSCKHDPGKIEKSLAWLEQPEHHLITYLQFPRRLQAIDSAPAVLFLAGDPALMLQPQMAIVGSRKPTSGGCENATYFARQLAASGLVILSGLATGIDGIAHRAALDVNGATTAVLGSGHNSIYPKNHYKLFEEIKQKGLLISEFTPDTPVRAHQFPRRNRIISGLSQAVLVVEAAIKSGSLVTCRLAAEQGRDVFAIPGDIMNPMSRGCHHLIRNGACLVEKPQQILDELALSITAVTKEVQQADMSRGLSKDERLVMDCVNRHPTSIESLMQRTGMAMPELLSLLFGLEMKQRIVASADGYFKKMLAPENGS